MLFHNDQSSMTIELISSPLLALKTWSSHSMKLHCPVRDSIYQLCSSTPEPIDRKQEHDKLILIPHCRLGITRLSSLALTSVVFWLGEYLWMHATGSFSPLEVPLNFITYVKNPSCQMYVWILYLLVSTLTP